jgi:hypothetical protein
MYSLLAGSKQTLRFQIARYLGVIQRICQHPPDRLWYAEFPFPVEPTIQSKPL